MTVRELIEKLQKFNPDVEVITEGCDCTGDIDDVEPYPAGYTGQVNYGDGINGHGLIITRKD